MPHVLVYSSYSGEAAEGVRRGRAALPATDLWARTTQERCKRIFVSSAAAVNHAGRGEFKW
uniref:Uncharacterized protein n=1 Tax=Hyaloperonospora arabidopsidis (strain Emoy2) TaxID=559515 RepID=M4B6E1_HYAAE